MNPMPDHCRIPHGNPTRVGGGLAHVVFGPSLPNRDVPTIRCTVDTIGVTGKRSVE